MNIGPFFSSDAIGLTLAADQQFLETPGSFDAVWQLETEECASVSLLSTLGLQARSFQIMPQVSINKVTQERIQDFFCQPSLDLIFSNYARLTISPVQDVKAVVEFWVRSGDWVQGRISITNHGETNAEIGARLAARLITLQGNSELKPTRQGYQTILKGQTGNLTVTLGMEGGSKTVLSPNLALEQSKHLAPGESLQTLWECVVQKNNTENNNRSYPANWDGEIARLEVANQARMVQIITPQSNWDAAFYSNQNQAFQLLRKDAQGQVSPDRTRGIHSAFTQSVPGARSGISAIELWQLIGSLLPAQVELSTKLLADYVEKASTDLKSNPHLALPFPCLCDLTWRVHQVYQQKDFLLGIYPAIKALCLAWFSLENDRDQDGFPEWSSIEQCGLISLPTFDLLDENTLATRISFTEQINLASLLAIELGELRKIAQVADDQSTMLEIESHLYSLNTFITDFADMNYQSSCLDRETHYFHSGEILFNGDLQAFGAKSIYLSKPARLNLRLKPSSQLKKPSVFYLHGENAEGEQVVEPVEPANLLWLPGSFFYTTTQVYARIDKITDLNLRDCHIQIHQANLQSHDLGILFSAPIENEQEPDRWNFKSVLAATNYGLPENLDTQTEKKVVNLGWNLLVLADLIRKGQTDTAFKLLGQLQQAQINHLRLEHNNTDRWNAHNGRLLGLRNTIGGLIPVSLILELDGVRILNENKVTIRGQNPFPWVFKVQYRGLEVTRDGKNTTVRFPDGTIEHHFGAAQKNFVHETDLPVSE